MNASVRWTGIAVLATLFLIGGLSACRPHEEPTAPQADPPEPQADPARSAAAALCLPRPGAFPPPEKLADWAQGAILFDDLGSFHRRITTRSEEAQRFFDQGMRLVWGFNHDEATRDFVKAAQLDPECAACWWGREIGRASCRERV